MPAGRVSSLMRSVAAVLASLLGVVAQSELGCQPPAACFGCWVQGEPIEFDSGISPACTVWAFYSQQPHLLSVDSSYLSQLQARYVDRDVRVVAVVQDQEQAGIDGWGNCSIVLDEAAHTEMAWVLADEEIRTNVLVRAKDGTVLFFGHPGAGLVDAIERALDDRFDLEPAERVAATRVEMPAMFDDALGSETVATLAPLVAAYPRDGLLNGLLYLALATKSNDDQAAEECLLAATARLSDEAQPLALFADLVLRGDSHRESVVCALREPIAKAAMTAKWDPAVQLAYLRVLIMAGDGPEVGRQAMRCRKVVMQTAAGCLDYATLLARDDNPRIHADLAGFALGQAEKLGADARLLAAARYTVELLCGGDKQAAHEVITAYLKDQGMRVGINNDSWHLMTELATMGRYDHFAVALVERLLEKREVMEHFEFDTAALAMFLVGRIEDAIELQSVALQIGGGSVPDYEERLARYRGHLSAMPR